MSRIAWVLAAITAAFLFSTTDVPASDAWMRTGLEWHGIPPVVVIVDQARVKDQIEAGCSETNIRFGDTTAMRNTVGPLTWPEKVRKLLSVAALTDTLEDALLLLSEAMATPGLDRVQAAILENQRILVALQFRDYALSTKLLQLYGLPDDLPGPILSDRMFWNALTNMATATSADWRSWLGPELDAAFEADPLSFQARTYRLIAWLEAEGWATQASCDAKIGEFSTLVLDISEASACPLMIGHVSHAMDRHFEIRERAQGAGERNAWRTFATGLLAVVSGEQGTAKAAYNYLANRTTAVKCLRQMASEISALEHLE